MADDQVCGDSSSNSDLHCDYGVTAGTFPCLGKCYVRNDSLPGDVKKDKA